ncbi:hypothetical protein B0H19DRAFT_390341 [Mycena capillaripes]|nr:hypothetical protein B0H19DRAFT_390341 [Mycena capillaripes]
MDLIQYYAKFGPKSKSARSNDEVAQKKSSSSGAPIKDSTQQALIPAVPVHSARLDYHFDDAPDSDVEEDDSKEIPEEDLRSLMRDSSTKSTQMRMHITDFNKSHRVECDRCMSRNQECRVVTASLRCEFCAKRKRPCERSDVFCQWMIRHKFQLSWKKAEEVLRDGKRLSRSAKKVVFVPSKAEEQEEDELEEEEQANAPVASTSAGVRTSPRTPVPRVRKEPSSLSVTVDPSRARARSRPRKRALSGPPRADHKRRKVVASETPELDMRPEPKSAPPNPGREIMPAPQFKPKPRVSTEQPKQPLERLRNPTITIPPLRDTAHAFLSDRVAATEKRLDALEGLFRMAEFGRAARQRVIAELDGTLGELEGNGDVQGAAGRLRALHTSLVDEEENLISVGGSWDPSVGVLLDDEQDAELDSVEPEDYIVEDDAVNDSDDAEPLVNGSSPTAVDDNMPIPENGLTTADDPMDVEPMLDNGGGPTVVDNSTEMPIPEEDLAITDGPTDAIPPVSLV